MTIEILIIGGLMIGLVIGIVFPRLKMGCLALTIIPIAMFLYIGWWQGENPDKLRSTSALEYLFGPLWPSIGAVVGFTLSRVILSFAREN